MQPIILFTNNPQLLAICSEALAAEDDVQVVAGLRENDAEEIQAAIAAYGSDVVIARGARAEFVRRLGLPVTVVDIPVTAFDLIRALEKAAPCGRRIAVAGVSQFISGMERLGPLLGLEILSYPVDHADGIPGIVNDVLAGGAAALVGGYSALSTLFAGLLPVVPIGTEREGILQAVEEARRIAGAIAREKMQSVLTRVFLDHAQHGVVAVDGANRVLALNLAAQRMLQISDSAAIGRRLPEIWPELDLAEALRTRREDKGVILDCGGHEVICNTVVVTLDAKTVAAVATFQDIGNIQQLEASVRRRHFETGLCAAGTFNDIRPHSPALRDALLMAKKFAVTDSSVMLHGETGTGKELFAQGIHNYSKRSKGPFVAVNCAALPPSLLESELFGYESGAFTGANPKGKQGMFELAHGGTLLLDEFGEMDPIVQGKFLRVLQERKVMRLGSDRLIPVDVRVITATHRDLGELVARNAFRRDLYYRLNVLRIRLPPLRECVEDIGPLARRFSNACTASGRSLHFTPAAVKLLQRHTWPGNVRELQNLVERLTALHGCDTLDADGIARVLGEEIGPPPAVEAFAPFGDAGQADPERKDIEGALLRARGNYTQAASILGISRITLWRKMRKYGDMAVARKRGKAEPGA